ncbi:hypothetical protein CCZ01_03655 [Helicobacter monodelphidis]|uniref:invasion protein CiaB n=1 Tax=Helicobacter sp. 15-1451 TaxID=2004995 RepID=UPI000DCE6255|nr:invasion protein CiaB [Helicobacter sp. 15-1451]RAX58180.1 hypothetical protein CCZ01_03655 [Helicobacter sp. 15-1451]
MKKAFYADLNQFCQIVQWRDDSLNRLYLELENDKNPEIQNLIQMLNTLNIQDTQPHRLALLTRLVQLQESAIIQILKKAQKSDEEIKEAKKILYNWVKDYHTQWHQKILNRCDEEELFTPFYRQILHGIHAIGKAFNTFHTRWRFRLIEEINPKLAKEYPDKQDLFKILESLRERTADGEQSDRSYSIPQYNPTQKCWNAIPYSLAFKSEIKIITKEIKKLLKELKNEGDEIFLAKKHYIQYFKAIENAFTEEKLENLLECWREVDRAWMKIQTPLQPAHPLEYYEDHYRRSVAPEWDMRVLQITHNKHLPIQTQMQDSFLNLYKKWAISDFETQSMKDNVLHSLNKTSLYLSLPALYYGAEMDGLFSAQVVPNDERVSQKYGKKIFAFPTRVLHSAQYRPFMRIAKEIFDENFLKERREILFFNEEIWLALYQISTIGHEFGHILWMDIDTEICMNTEGNFKNIEEWKATTGGLLNFFLNDTLEIYQPLRLPLLADVITRAVGLIAWREQEEVKPYYCEGLIHLSLLFSANILAYKNSRLQLNLTQESYETFKAIYFESYEKIAKLYMQKANASIFLNYFTQQDAEGYHIPKDQQTKEFVEFYWTLYKEIGQETQQDNEHLEYLQEKERRKNESTS